jgi:tetratricopeptide (TPR) repeat protein
VINVIVSGQAGAFAVLSKTAVLYHLNGSSLELASNDLSAAFRGCTDVRKLKVSSTAEAHETCRELCNNDRALRFVLHLLDGRAGDQAELAEAAERLLEPLTAIDFVSNSFYVDALPNTDTIQAVLEEFSNFPRLTSVLVDVLRDQSTIRLVRELFEKADYSEFESDASYQSFRQRIFQSGIQRELVGLVRAAQSIEFFLLRLNSNFRGVAGSRRAIESWTASFRAQRKRLPDHIANEEDYLDPVERSNSSTRGRGILEQIRSQQAAIEQRLKSRDIASAEKFASDLIRGQKSSSTPEQIAKSLSLLAHLAKVNGVPELQLAWADEAVNYNPNDWMTFSHLVDAFVVQNRLHEASQVMDRAEKLHQGLFVLNARARLLRARGDFEEARAMYLKGAADFPHDPEYQRARSGSAETLRDMGRYDQALEEYNKLVQEFPTEEVLWCGLASVYLDMGMFDEAILNFGKAIRGREIVARNGRATAYKQAGQFDQALRIYDQVIREYPNDGFALCGRADVFRVKGDIPNALASYDLAIDRNPFTPEPIKGKFEVLRESGDLIEAGRLLEAARERFPEDPALASFHAELLESRGDWTSALSAYDNVIKNFPRAINAKLGRARILRRIGRARDALDVYGAVLAAQPYSTPAQLGKAATFIELRDFAPAELLLRQYNDPKSLVDWRKHFLMALLLQAQNNHKRSKSMFEFGMRKTPFVKIRRLYTAAFARLKLRQGEPSLAVLAIDAEPNEVSNVIRLHALAASGRIDLAHDAWSRIKADDSNLELATEIACRFQIVPREPQHDLAWIYSSEERAMLLEAA